MTLYRQIALIVTLVFTILLVTVILVSFNILKDSVKEELYNNAQNSVSSLAVSISNTSIEQGNIETMINAIFDNGNYENISFKNQNGEMIYQKNLENKEFIIPYWFEKFVNFEVPVAKSTISKGWKIIGTLEILNDKNIIYKQLYSVVINLFWYISMSCIVFLIVLYFLFHKILKPLLEIQKQAEQVLNNEFIIQKHLPNTKEFRLVINSINKMIKKFESIYENATQTLIENKELMYTDSVTSLKNRKYFLLKANEFINEESSKNFGTIIVISIKMDLLNQGIGYKKTDEFLCLFSQELELLIKIFDESFVCRINGTEMIILLPKISIEKTILIVNNIIYYDKKELRKLELNEKEYGVNIGILNYEKEKNISLLFSKIDFTICQAKLFDSGRYYLLENNNEVALGRNKWKQSINNGLKNDKFNVIYRKVVDIKFNKNIHHVISFNMSYESCNAFSYGTLIGPIIEAGMIEDVYLHIIKKVLLINDDIHRSISLQLCSEFLGSLDSYEKIKHLFNETKNQIRNKIIFEISESLIEQYYESSFLYIKLFREFGFDFAINNFIADSDDYEYLKELKPLFIKSDKQYLLDNKQNLNILKIILDSLEIDLIATGVSNNNELNELNKRGITIISGIIVDELN